MTYDILATGSSGNAVVINGEILIDCGVPTKRLRESRYIKSLKLVLLTHEHGDHFKPATVRALHKERPALRWCCCEWMVPHLREAGMDKRAIDIFDPGLLKVCDKGRFCIKAELLVHDVPNCGWKIHIHDPVGSDGDSLFYATDTATLDSVSACCYDYYLIESNHTQAEIEARIEDKLSRGEFAYETRAARNHLSQEQAKEWLAQNAGPNSRCVFLHQHKDKEGPNG